ncbi:Mut7-C RNAse domain-containing protein [Thermomicrobium sp.]
MRWSAGSVVVRAYAALNDFLPPPVRQRSFEVPLPLGATVRDLVAGLGIPPPEVDLVLVNGEPADWAVRLQDGDRVAMYPVFETIDIGSVQRLRPEPLREPRFVCDVHLGRLAAYLRLLGFDTRYERAADDATLAAWSERERRIVLTRDRELLKRRAVTHGYWLRSVDPREQLREVVRRFDLMGSLRPFVRCPRCNGSLVRVEREVARQHVPPRSWQRALEFWRCSGCDQFYWYDTHCQRVEELIEWLRSTLSGGPTHEQETTGAGAPREGSADG